MGLHVANPTALSDRVCRPCGREKETPFGCILLLKVVYRGHFLEIHHVRIRQVRIRRPPDSNDSCHPQFRRQIGGQRRSFEAKKSLRFLENSENELRSEDKNEEMITPQLNKPLVELNLNVDDLLSYQSTQVKVAMTSLIQVAV